MAIVRRLKDMFGFGEEREQYRYQCNVCHATFASTEPDEGAVGCPECGGMDVRSA